jgi:DNA-binding MarR family transcriptional regulator
MRQESAAAPAPAGPLRALRAEATPFRSVGFALSSLGLAVTSRFAERLAPLGLEPRDFGLLRAVGAAEGSSQQAVGERLGVPPSRMVGFVDSLERRGLLERRAHPEDRRARALHLTPAGRSRLAEAFGVATSFETELCAGLAPGERELLLARLEELMAALGLRPGVHAGAADARPDG